ncbi:hypothetical protein BASA60_007982 [Batrachochytrium salamandrivorans]|nr:hypothetical protein BASA60_007982 [Batrachochytrium salamandrivorans]
MRGWDQQQGGDAAFVGHLPYRKEMPEEAPTGISSVISHKAFDCDSRPDTGRSISVNASVNAAASSAAVVGELIARPPHAHVPSEVWLRVFSRLNHTLLLRVSTVCKRWWAISVDQLLWKRLCYLHGVLVEGTVFVLMQDLSLSNQPLQIDWKSRFMEHMKRQQKDLPLSELLCGLSHTNPLQEMTMVVPSLSIRLSESARLPRSPIHCRQCYQDNSSNLGSLIPTTSFSSHPLGAVLPLTLRYTVDSTDQPLPAHMLAGGNDTLDHTPTGYNFMLCSQNEHVSPYLAWRTVVRSSPSFLLHTLQEGCYWAPSNPRHLSVSPSSSDLLLLTPNALVRSMQESRFAVDNPRSIRGVQTPFSASVDRVQQEVRHLPLGGDRGRELGGEDRNDQENSRTLPSWTTPRGMDNNEIILMAGQMTANGHQHHRQWVSKVSVPSMFIIADQDSGMNTLQQEPTYNRLPPSMLFRSDNI